MQQKYQLILIDNKTATTAPARNVQK